MVLLRHLTISFLAFAVGVSYTSPSGPLSTLGPDLARTRVLAQTAGERLWPGYGSAPFGMLLIADGRETLLCQPDLPKSFKPVGMDPATGCTESTRPRSALPDNLLAAMPIFGPNSTIVMGTPEKTGFARQDWLRTILHEHFHQWQISRPGYFARIDALDLKGDDTSGMWMLNFPFPYAAPDVGKAYSTASLTLADALDARGKPNFLPAFDRYIDARHHFADAAGTKNWRYLDFELWQEGSARWTEYTLTRTSEDKEARQSALASETHTLARLRRPDLERQGRELVYTYGTAELMLIDACSSAWREAYSSSTSIGTLLLEARAHCRK